MKSLSIFLVGLTLFSSVHAFSLEQRIGNVDTKLKVYGFVQLEARGGKGSIDDAQDSNAKFSAQRVRLGMNYSADIVRGKLFVDFNQDSTVNAVNGDVGLPKHIKDAFIALRFNKAFVPKLGLIKMPHGMSFTMPGWNLDIVERGLDKKLALERNMGLMISGRDMFLGNNAKVSGFEMGHERAYKGFGYDLMIANQVGRSGAVSNVKPGDANAYAARLMFDYTELFHSEISYGISESAGGIDGHEREDGSIIVGDTKDYKSLNFGIDSNLERLNAKFEYFDSKNIKGEKGWDESTLALTSTYYISDTFELAGKHIQASALKSGIASDLGNTYFGFNYYMSTFDNKMDRNSKRKRNAHRISINYILATGDTNDKWNGLGGYINDAVVLQAQFKF